MSDELMRFSQEEMPEDKGQDLQVPAWKVLSVEDNPGFQATLRFSLSRLRVRDRPIQFLTAGSAAEGALVIAENPDIAVILLDVVMEEDDSGLKLVKTIREGLGNTTVRIILLTGQPGMAPLADVMSAYDIDDYWVKTKLSHENLTAVITANIRTWEQLTRLEQSRQGLQMIIEASRNLQDHQQLDSYAGAVLEELSRVIGINHGLAIISGTENEDIGHSQVIVGTGRYRSLSGEMLSRIKNELLSSLLREAHKQQAHIIGDTQSMFFFQSHRIDRREYFIFTENEGPLSEFELSLLEAYCEHVGSGFRNVALHNQLSRAAYYDTLLGCPSREWLVRQLGRLTESERSQYDLVVLAIDQFHQIQVTFGASYTDDLLTGFYQYLQQKLPNQWIVRLENDELAILTVRQADLQERFLRQLLVDPVPIADGYHIVSATIGHLPLEQLGSSDPRHIISVAQTLVTEARRKGLGYQAFSPELEHQIGYRYSLLADLRTAIHRNELFVVLQPKVRLSDAAVVGFEALVRWRKPNQQMVPPDEFIPLAETSGLIRRLDEQVLSQTCDVIRQLSRAGYELPVSFNVSTAEIRLPDFFQRLQDLISQHHIAYRLLDMEVTETAAMEDYARVAPQLRALIEQGMDISIDDFGTGYSSLSHVTDLAATTLKIDRQFVSQLDQGADAEIVIDLILRLSERFNLKVVAEGIETEEQARLLQAKGCVYGQGYLYSRPLPMTDLLIWLQDKKVVNLSAPDQR